MKKIVNGSILLLVICALGGCVSSIVRNAMLNAPISPKFELHADPAQGQYALYRGHDGSEILFTVVGVKESVAEVSWRHVVSAAGVAEDIKQYEWHAKVRPDGTVTQAWITKVGSQEVDRDLKLQTPGAENTPVTSIHPLPAGMPKEITVNNRTFPIRAVKLTVTTNQYFTMVVAQLLSDQARFRIVRSRLMYQGTVSPETIKNALNAYDPKNATHKQVADFLFGTPDPSFGRVTTSDIAEMK